jgi:erythromycin esterase-like protein
MGANTDVMEFVKWLRSFSDEQGDDPAGKAGLPTYGTRSPGPSSADSAMYAATYGCEMWLREHAGAGERPRRGTP